MDALTTSLLVAVAVFLSSLVGLSLHRVVPEGHLSQETRSVILLGTGTLSLLASLVLGLLVSTAKSSYDATETRIQNYAAELILLDETLRDYGDSALPATSAVAELHRAFYANPVAEDRCRRRAWGEPVCWCRDGARSRDDPRAAAGGRGPEMAAEPGIGGEHPVATSAVASDRGRWSERAAGVYRHPRVLGYAHIRELRVQRAAECNGRDRLSVLLAGDRQRNLPDP